MLYDSQINHMDEDELRNYAHHQNEIEERYGELVHAKTEMIELFQRLYNTQQYMYARLNELNLCRDRFVGFESEMRTKYEKYGNVPYCSNDSHISGKEQE